MAEWLVTRGGRGPLGRKEEEKRGCVLRAVNFAGVMAGVNFSEAIMGPRDMSLTNCPPTVVTCVWGNSTQKLLGLCMAPHCSGWTDGQRVAMWGGRPVSPGPLTPLPLHGQLKA